MDAVLKHLGLRSDFIVCHPDMIDDPLFHARRPPSLPHTHSQHRAARCILRTLQILSICNIYMDPGVWNWFSYRLISSQSCGTQW